VFSFASNPRKTLPDHDVREWKIRIPGVSGHPCAPTCLGVLWAESHTPVTRLQELKKGIKNIVRHFPHRSCGCKGVERRKEPMAPSKRK
jgi:hypothetical protein